MARFVGTWGSSLSGAIALLVLAACGASDDGVDCSDEETCSTTDGLGTVPAPFVVERVHATRYPIVLHHGFNASTTNAWSFNGVEKTLERDGHWVVASEVEPFAGVPTRARRLAAIVDKAIADFCAERASGSAQCLANTKVNLVAHSMGGLDARYLASSLGYGAKIASITTISSPHRGSAVADVALGLLPDGGRFAKAIDQLAACFGRTFTQTELAGNTDVHAAFVSLAEANADGFNRQNPDVPGVYYQSWAGVSRAIGGPRVRASQDALLAACEGVHYGTTARADFMSTRLAAGSFVVGSFGAEFEDGMVTVDSAKWGVFRGCFEADHLDEVGQVAKTHADAYTKFDHLAFYRVVATELADRGF